MSTGSDGVAKFASGEKLSVLMLCGLYPPAYRGGGPIRTTFAIAETHSGSVRFQVITSDHDWGETEPLDVEPDRWTERNEARVWYVRNNSLLSLLRAIYSARKTPLDFVYLNSFFNPIYSIIPAVLFKFRLFGRARLIVAPRGEFGPAARGYKSAKKALFVNFCLAVGLHKLTIWHASSEIEATDVRRTFPQSNVIVRMNESTLPAQALRHRTAERDRIRLVFISRIAEIKGVSILLKALDGIQSKVRLDIYGPSDDPAYLSSCHKLAEALPQQIEVVFNAGIDNSQVRDLFGVSDAFFLPTEQENFGHAIAESLSAGCPVYVADVTPWSCVIRNGGGVIVPSRDTGDWHRAIADFCSLSSEQRHLSRLAAARAYEEWRSTQHGPSVFELAIQD